MRRPGHTSDGRKAPEARPSLPTPSDEAEEAGAEAVG